MRFVDSPQRALFRHPNEAFLYDLDGSLTGTGIVENYTLGGSLRGSSFVGTSLLLPPASCEPSNLSTMSGVGTGGSICRGLIFRRLFYKIRNPSAWVGKALCVRTPWAQLTDRCQSLKPQCNCLPYLDMVRLGNVFLAAEGQRYEIQVNSLKLFESFVRVVKATRQSGGVARAPRDKSS
jgi:hypothetical protein